MSVVVVTAPAPLVTLSEAKRHLRLGQPGEEASYTAEDPLLTAYIAAAEAHIDGPGGWLGRAIGLQTLEYRRDAFWSRCSDIIDLPYPPIVDVVSVKYLDDDGVEQTLASGWEVTGGSTLRPSYDADWPSTQTYADAVRIRYRAGYVADATADPLVAAIPAPITAAVLLMVGDLYAHRETAVIGANPEAVQMSTTVENLLAPFRVWSL